MESIVLVGAEDVSRFSDASLCRLVARELEQLGFATVGVDRRGYRAGGAEASAVDEISLTGKRARTHPSTAAWAGVRAGLRE